MVYQPAHATCDYTSSLDSHQGIESKAASQPAPAPCGDTSSSGSYQDLQSKDASLVARTEADHDTSPIPTSLWAEGGFLGCLTLFGGFVGSFATMGQVSSFGTYQAWYAGHQLSSYSPSEISWIGGLQLWVMMFSGGLIGRLFDAYGPTLLLASGTLIYTLSLMMTSLATRYYQFMIAQGFLLGLGAGLVYNPCIAASTTRFRHFAGTSSGIVLSGSGGAVFPLLLQRLLNSVGFAWAVRIQGFLALACCIIATLTISSPLPRNKNTPWIDTQSFRDAKYVLVCLAYALICLGLFIPSTYIVQYAQAQGLSENAGFDLLSIMNAANTVGRIVPGWFADKLGRLNLMIPSALLAGSSCITLWLFAHDAATLAAFAVLYGVFAGATMGLDVAVTAQISPPENIGTRVGMSYAFMSIPSLIGSPIGGAIYARQHGAYSGMIVFTAIFNILGFVFLLAVKLMINRNIFVVV
ncbi:MFS general substrate transporter [Suillus paluster]|uniref:MFS general substrate transporter n=1 Tax=Suillus paluster TaxID=48578 RepID=UPI001B863116|nr:MFS general substrate transporter [Suillus paluster]KAG1735933.1 MFS general substrate transporter [Suillus paluster]